MALEADEGLKSDRKAAKETVGFLCINIVSNIQSCCIKKIIHTLPEPVHATVIVTSHQLASDQSMTLLCLSSQIRNK